MNHVDFKMVISFVFRLSVGGENDLNTQSARVRERGKSEKSSWKNASY